MPHHVFTRQDLYDRVWREPMLTIARELGVSDVGLAKACRAHQVPTPPRGYWAKLKAGKSVGKRPRLPACVGKANRIVIAPAIKSPVRSQAVRAVLDAVADQPEIPIPHDLRNPHPIVKTWLDQDAATRVRARREGWGASGEDLRHGLAHRRLRLTSALLKALVARGLVVDQAYTWLTARRGEDKVEFRFSERTQFVPRPATDYELRWAPERTMVRSAQPAGDLILSIRDCRNAAGVFRETNYPLETQLPRIVVTLEAELIHREERRLERAREEEAYRLRQAEARRRDAHAAAERALETRLLQEASRHAQAGQLRAYLAAADQATMAADPAYPAWRAWAQRRLEALDPLTGVQPPFALLGPYQSEETQETHA